MEIPDRVVRITYADGCGLVAADRCGRLHLLDHDLHLVASSGEAVPGDPAYGLCISGSTALTRHRDGSIAKWSLPDLRPVAVYAATAPRDGELLLPEEEPSPNIQRGLTVWGGNLYTNNGFEQLVVLDVETFSAQRILASPTGEVPIEWICIDCPQIHALSDKTGRLFLGDLDSLEFPNVVEVDAGANLHRVQFDRRHNRFWVTQDSGDSEHRHIANGVVAVSLSGEILDQCLFARDDVEFLAFSPDFMHAYSGGFDGYLEIFDNSSERLTVEREVGPFSHQLSDLAVAPNGDVFVLSQDGELVRLSPQGEPQARANFRRQCIWDIQKVPGEALSVYCATDDGVAKVSLAESAPGAVPGLTLVAQAETRYGFTRRLVPAPTGWYGMTRDCRVFRSQADGREQWCTTFDSLPHDIAVHPDGSRILVATNAGTYELDCETGHQIDCLRFDDIPNWACSYDDGKQRILATRNGLVRAVGTRDRKVNWQRQLPGYPKRMWFDGNRQAIMITGDGVSALSPRDGQLIHRWTELMNNTAENACIIAGIVHIVGYGCQLVSYDFVSEEPVGLIEHLPDLAVSIASIEQGDGETIVLAGGRTGFMSVFKLVDGVPQRWLDWYLPPQRRVPPGVVNRELLAEGRTQS